MLSPFLNLLSSRKDVTQKPSKVCFLFFTLIFSRLSQMPSFILIASSRHFLLFSQMCFFIDYVYLLHTSSASISLHNFLIFLIDIFPVLSHSVMSNSLRYYGLQPIGSSFHGDFPGKHTEGGCHALLQRSFPTQGLKQDLPHCRWFLYQLSHQGSMYFLVIQQFHSFLLNILSTHFLELLSTTNLHPTFLICF